MKKKSIIVICAVLVISGVATVLVLTGNRGNVSNVKRVVGYSALYGENSIKEAFDVIEKKFAKDFEGCTLTELRYDEDVEKATEIVQKWSDEHPEKTYAQDFFEKFPKAQIDSDGTPLACRNAIYGGGCPKIEPNIECCCECWDEQMEE